MLILMMMMAANRKQQQHQQHKYQQHQQRQESQQSPIAPSRPIGKSSNSSNETVIAPVESPQSASSSVATALSLPLQAVGEQAGTVVMGTDASPLASTEQQLASSTPTTTSDCADAGTMLSATTNDEQNKSHNKSSQTVGANEAPSQRDSHEASNGSNAHSAKRNSRLKSFFLLTSHLIPFHHHSTSASTANGDDTNGSPVVVVSAANERSTKRKSSLDALGRELREQIRPLTPSVSGNTAAASNCNIRHQQQRHHHRNYLALFNLASRYFGGGGSRFQTSASKESQQELLQPPAASKSAPVTPVKLQPLDDAGAHFIRANGYKLDLEGATLNAEDTSPRLAPPHMSSPCAFAGAYHDGHGDENEAEPLVSTRAGKTESSPPQPTAAASMSKDELQTQADAFCQTNGLAATAPNAGKSADADDEIKSSSPADHSGNQQQKRNGASSSRQGDCGIQTRPSVRFSESICDSDDERAKVKSKRWTSSRQHYADQAVQTCPELSGAGAEKTPPSMTTSADSSSAALAASLAANRRHLLLNSADNNTGGLDLVSRLFPKLPTSVAAASSSESGSYSSGPPDKQQRTGECPMDSERFRQYGYSLIDYISNYLDTIGERRVTPLNIEPGYLKSLIQPDAPEKGESFANIMHDFENHIMCGITHWQHPHFHAYFPAGNAYPSILADMLSDALGCVGFSWAASPAYTELEIIMLDWMGKMIGLPDEFLCLSGGRNGQESKGGGVIQGSASECVLVNLLAARHCSIEKLRKKYPSTPDGMLLSKLIGYCSKEAHSCVEKAAMIGFIRMRALDTDEKHSLRGETLSRAMAMDRAQGLEPFLVCATLGTTSCVSFDNLVELGQICKEQDIWMHVDAAYAGSALICPEFKYLIEGIEMASSFNMNPNKWMLINFDCSLMWVKDRFKLTRAFVVDPLYLQHSYSDQAIDYRHWGIPLSRRFRALKLWFVIRNYGVEGLQAYIRNHVELAKLFEQLVRQDARFMITNEVVLGLVCFRLIGSNALNQRLLSMINASGKLHMVPASLNGRYVIRFCVCDQNAQENDIRYAYKCISEFASELFESIRLGKERIRAISQQNTIDVSSISLQTQQSASSDRLSNMAGQQQDGPSAQQASGGSSTANGNVAAAAAQQVVGGFQPQVSPVSPREAARQHLVGRSSRGANTASTITKSELLEAAPVTPALPPQPLTPLSARASSAVAIGGVVGRSPLMKQSSVAQQASEPQLQQQTTSAAAACSAANDEEDLEQEIVLDSLATIDGYDYDLDDEDDDDDDLLEQHYFDEHQAQQQQATLGDSAPGPIVGPNAGGERPQAFALTSFGSAGGGAATCRAADRSTASGGASSGSDESATASRHASAGQQQLEASQSPFAARRWHSRTGRASRNQTTGGTGAGEQDEAEDEVFTLAERRNRMSLRYKREFFVRVVSDPRVYRASISGDINAHASCCSLGGNRADTALSQSQQQRPRQSSQQQLEQNQTSVPSARSGSIASQEIAEKEPTAAPENDSTTTGRGGGNSHNSNENDVARR